MYQASQAFIDKCNDTSRTFCARITCGSDTVSDDIKTILFTMGSCGADTFTIGSVFASYVDITLYPVDLSLSGKEINVELGLALQSGDVEYIPMGVYTVSPADIVKSRDLITVKAYDRLISKCSGLYVPAVTFPCSLQAVIDDLSTQTGVIIKTSMDATGRIDTPMDGLLYREALGYIAGLLGGFCYADRGGIIRITPYPAGASVEIPAERFWGIEMAEDTYLVDALTVTVREGGEDADGNPVEGLSYSSGTGTGISVSNPYMTADLFASMKDRVVGYSYHPGNVVMLGDPRLGPEDMVKAINYAGTEYLLPCMSLIHEYDGGLTTTIAAPGNAVSDDNMQGPLTRQVEKLYTDMVLAKEVIAKKITADEADLKYATIAQANIIEADIETLRAGKVDINMANIDTAWIESLFVKGKLVTEDITAATGTFTKYLTGVKILGDLIDAHTITADRIIIRDPEGNTGLLYELNNGAVTQTGLTEEELKRLTLDGKVITAESITADKINVTDLFAQDITATGTITGVSLVGATGSFSGQVTTEDIIATGGTIGGWEIKPGKLQTTYNKNGVSDENQIVHNYSTTVSFNTDSDKIINLILTDDVPDSGDGTGSTSQVNTYINNLGSFVSRYIDDANEPDGYYSEVISEPGMVRATSHYDLDMETEITAGTVLITCDSDIVRLDYEGLNAPNGSVISNYIYANSSYTIGTYEAIGKSGNYAVFGNNGAITRIATKTVSSSSTGYSFGIGNGYQAALASSWDQNADIYLCGGQDATSKFLRSYPVYVRTYASAANVVVTSTGIIGRSTSSSIRYKHDVEYYSNEEHRVIDDDHVVSGQMDENEMLKVLNIPVVSFKYNDGYITGGADYDYDKPVVGFIADDVASVCPDCATYTDINGEMVPESWDERQMIPRMLFVVQKHHRQIQDIMIEHNADIAKIETMLALLEEEIKQMAKQIQTAKEV